MLYDKLKEHSKSGIYPMHMPGHKQNHSFMPRGFPCEIDITEIHGFDDLHNPQGVLLETEILAAKLYGSLEALMLINGTTVGILAAIGAHAKRGDKILAVNNCHWSTTNAADLFGLDIEYITLEADELSGVPCSVTPDSIALALEKNPDIKLVIITSPTYEGVVSDIASIASVVHNAGGILIVDAAHGAHLGFSDGFPENATKLGADIVVMSLHKTLPALTQCSLLHICSERVDVSEVKRLLSILQTSSPSYVLMASIDYCLRLLESNGDRLFSEYEKNLNAFRRKTGGRFICLESKISRPQSEGVKRQTPRRTDWNRPPVFFDYDPGKIVIVTKNTALNGSQLADILRNEYKIEIERVYDDYVIAMTSICDKPEGFNRLASALCAIDESLAYRSESD